MKAIMISIKPQHLANILNGKKTIEIRKNKALASAIEKLIKEYGYADIYVYCTKGKVKKDFLTKSQKFGYILCPENALFNRDKTYDCNGKFVCSFKCYKVEEISFDDKEVQRKACLTEDELFDYLFVNEPYHEDMKKGYAIHISDLKIFDTPKELSEFKHERKFENTPISEIIRLTKAPQNFAYVEIEE